MSTKSNEIEIKEVEQEEIKVEKKKKEAVKKNKTYDVVVNSALLNVRKGPSKEFDVVCIIKKDEVYKILKETNGWGKIEYGPNSFGFIDLSFVTKK